MRLEKRRSSNKRVGVFRLLTAPIVFSMCSSNALKENLLEICPLAQRFHEGGIADSLVDRFQGHSYGERGFG